MTPRLSAHLSRLRYLVATPDDRPHFETREEAEEAAADRSAESGERYVVTPVWRIDHDNLEACEPVAWSWSRNVV